MQAVDLTSSNLNIVLLLLLAKKKNEIWDYEHESLWKPRKD